jgi:hypothetical protein
VIAYNNEISWKIIWNISASENIITKICSSKVISRTRRDRCLRPCQWYMSVVMAGRVNGPHKNNCRASEGNGGGVRYTHRQKRHATLVLKLLGYNIAFKHK